MFGCKKNKNQAERLSFLSTTENADMQYNKNITFSLND